MFSPDQVMSSWIYFVISSPGFHGNDFCANSVVLPRRNATYAIWMHRCRVTGIVERSQLYESRLRKGRSYRLQASLTTQQDDIC